MMIMIHSWTCTLSYTSLWTSPSHPEANVRSRPAVGQAMANLRLRMASSSQTLSTEPASCQEPAIGVGVDQRANAEEARQRAG